MTPEQQRRVEELFLALLDAPAEGRGVRLAALCPDDAAVRAEVLSLLAHEKGNDDKFLNGAELLVTSLGLGGLSSAAAIHDDPPLPRGAKVGDYTIHEVLGTGGMGVVYVAEQGRPRRTVALKVIRRGLATAGLVKRFEYEAEVLGRLHHPGIAQIFEAGAAEVRDAHGAGGVQPYIAMEIVRGRALTEYARARELSTRERLSLIARVCDAVQHAHQRGVIHRDLKPGNILVDDSGQPKVLDFGVARAANSDLRVTTMQTSVGQLIGTLPYMSPEQVLADPGEVDTRADVYALGVIMYQLLTGKLPHDLGSRSIPEAARVIRDEEPARLSSISKLYRGDIETIVFKALEKDKTRRYQSAADLGADIRRHLAGEPIAAKNESAMYLLRRQLKRYRGLVAAVSIFVMGLGVFAGYAGLQARRNSTLALGEREAKDAAVLARDAAQRQFENAERERQRADEQARLLRRNLYLSRIGFAQAAYLNNDADRVKRLLEGCPVDLRGWEWRYLSRASDTSARSWTLNPIGLNAAEVYSTGGPGARVRMMGMRVSEPVRVWDGESAEPVLTIDSGAVTVVMSRDADRVAIQKADGTVEVWSVPLGSRIAEGKICEGVGTVWCFFDSGDRLLSTTDDKRAVVWDAATGGVIREFPIGAGAVRGADTSPDGTRIAMSYLDGSVRAWDVETGMQLFAVPGASKPVRSVRFSPDGKRLAFGGHDTTIREVDGLTGAPVQTLRHHGNKIWSVAYSPDGAWIASSGTEASIRIAETATGRVVRTLYGHKSSVLWLGFSDDGRTLFSASRDGVVKAWTGLDEPDVPMVPNAGFCRVAAISPDGTLLACGRFDEVVLVDARTREVVRELRGHKGDVMDLAFSPEGSLLVTVSWDESARTWDVATGRELRVYEPGGANFAHMRFSPDGRLVAGTCRDGTTKVWDPRSGVEVVSLGARKGEAIGVAWSPDGSRLYVGGQDKEIVAWDTATWTEAGVLRGHTSEVYALVTTPDGRALVSASEDSTLRIWDLAGDAEPRVLVGHTGPIYNLCLNADGSRIASGSFDNTVRLWDLLTGEQILTLQGHVYSVYSVQFSPDGEYLLSSGDDGEVRLWGYAEAR
jgi:WD40 repeat protein